MIAFSKITSSSVVILLAELQHRVNHILNIIKAGLRLSYDKSFGQYDANTYV